MTLRKAHLGLAIILAFLTLIALFLGNQRQAYADSLAEDIICETYAALQEAGSPIPEELESACGGGVPEDSDTDTPDVPVDGAEINCEIYAELNATGEWNPTFFPTFDPGSCGDGGNGGEEPTDVCPNIEGVQESVPQGKVLVDGNCVDQGGGSENPACSDGIDNDADGKIDMEDPGCSDADDSSETDPVSGGGGGGGGGGGSGGSSSSIGGTVLGTSTPAISCDMYLTDFIKMGAPNNPEQVRRLQSVLRNDEKADVEVNGEYDIKTLAAVHILQTKYAAEILTPWGIKESTGFVFLTTRKKINEIYCKSTNQFPLSTLEQKVIEEARANAPIPAPVVKKTESKVEPVMEMETTKAPGVEMSESAQEKKETVLPGNKISDFFRRLFDRFR